MEIEDHYGDNQDIFFQSAQGDIILNQDNGQVGIIHKNCKRIFIINNSDTIDLIHWLTENRVDIYRPDRLIQDNSLITKEYVNELISNKSLIFVTRNY